MRKVQIAGNRTSSVRTAAVKALSTALAVVATACGGGGESSPAVKESEPGNGGNAVMEVLPLVKFATPTTVQPS